MEFDYEFKDGGTMKLRLRVEKYIQNDEVEVLRVEVRDTNNFFHSEVHSPLTREEAITVSEMVSSVMYKLSTVTHDEFAQTPAIGYKWYLQKEELNDGIN